MWAALTAHAVNSLAEQERCCPHSCAPCEALQVLHDDSALELTLWPYVKTSGGDWDWWDHDSDRGPATEDGARMGRFRWEWVMARWCDPERCPDRNLV